MGFYENPLIGWFLKKRIKKIIIFIIISLFLYFLFYKNHTHTKSSGCKRPDCISSICTGMECIASGCNGDNCKGGDCIGEECEAGSCKGVGCRAGDCYGKDCIPGICIDPNCSSKDAGKNICIPFCKYGTAYNLPVGGLYKYTNQLPNNTLLNPSYCKTKKPGYILKDDKHLWNYKIDTINFDFSGTKTPEDIANPDDLQAGKTYILSNDTTFTSTYPNIEKKYNCTWCTHMKDNEICASYKPYLNPIKNEYTWYPDNWKCETLKDNGKPDTCKKSNDNMKLVRVASVKYKINLIKNSNKTLAQQNFEIENILGEMLTFQCKKDTCTQHINLRNNLTNLDGSLIPCTRRSYIIKPVTINNTSLTIQPQYKINGFNKYILNSPEEKLYLSNYINSKKTFRDHHVWVYENTIENTQNYRCHWCKQVVSIENQALPRKSNGILDTCFHSNDYNHYMYQVADDNKNIYLKCLKCDKEVYIK